MIRKFRKKPVVIEAMQYDGRNPNEVLAFADTAFLDSVGGVSIVTLEGDMKVSVDDYVIKGVQGEFYPCKPDIFAATYEPEN